MISHAPYCSNKNCGGCKRVPGERPHSFMVVFNGSSDLVLSANNEEEMLDWMQVLCEAVVGKKVCTVCVCVFVCVCVHMCVHVSMLMCMGTHTCATVRVCILTILMETFSAHYTACSQEHNVCLYVMWSTDHW